jgi:hypothetical protein
MNKKCDPLSSAATVRRLVAAGCPMPGEIQQERQRDLTIEVSRPQATIAYDMHAGAEYVFGVRITNRSYSCLVLQEFRCRLPWPAQVLLLGDPRSYSPECENYRLESGRKFRCEDVLNHRVRENGGLEPGESFEGLLLAYTMFDRISSEYLHGETATARVCVFDQYCREHRVELEILIDRSATMRPLKPCPRGQGLFEPREASKSQSSLDSFTVTNSMKPGAPTAEAETPGD